MNPPSQAEKLRQDVIHTLNDYFGDDGMTDSNFTHFTNNNLAVEEVMTAIADYISGIELPEKKDTHPVDEDGRAVETYGYEEEYNSAITQLETTLKDIEKELRK